MNDLFIEKKASISSCGKYRYILTREWNPNLSKCSFGMVNPSTADANTDDATIRKCIGFAQRNGFGGFVVWNLFAWRATDVKELAKIFDPIGSKNDLAIASAFMASFTHIAAWGDKTKIPKKYLYRVSDVVLTAQNAGIDFKCFGTTKNGDPRHPLMTPYNTPMTKWKSVS